VSGSSIQLFKIIKNFEKLIFKLVKHKFMYVTIVILSACPSAFSESTEIKTEEVNTSHWNGFLSVYGAARRLDQNLNQGNTAKVQRLKSEVATVLDYKNGDFSTRLRIDTQYSDIPFSTEKKNEYHLDLPLFAWRYKVDSKWTLTAGRINLALDDGQSFHPIDVFEDALRGTDFEDRLGRNRGFPLLMTESLLSHGSLRFIFSDDTSTKKNYIYGDQNPNYNRSHRQFIISLRQSIDQLTLNGVAQYNLSGYPGLGASFSWVADAAISFYGASFSEKGNRWPIHENVYLNRDTNLNATDVYINESPMQPWKKSDGRIYTRWLLGANWTAESGATVVAELWRDGRGMNSEQFSTWQNVLAFHSQLNSSLARRINLGYDLEALRTANGTHLFLRYTTNMFTTSSIQVSNLLAQDASGSVAFRFGHRPNDTVDLSLEAWQRYGQQNSRYGSTPDKRGISLNIRRFF
jgi:hypothetical protein